MSAPATSAVTKAGIDTGDLDLSRVTIGVMPGWVSGALGSRIGAMTLGDRILVARDRYESVISGEDPVLLLHELVHVNQWRREGKFRFVLAYMSDYFRNRLIGLDHRVAYRAIGFEAAAFDTSERSDRELM